MLSSNASRTRGFLQLRSRVYVFIMQDRFPSDGELMSPKLKPVEKTFIKLSVAKLRWGDEEGPEDTGSLDTPMTLQTAVLSCPPQGYSPLSPHRCLFGRFFLNILNSEDYSYFTDTNQVSSLRSQLCDLIHLIGVWGVNRDFYTEDCVTRMANMLTIRKVQFCLGISSFLGVSNISMLLRVLHVAWWTSSLKAATGPEPQAFISSLLHQAVDVFGTCWILCCLCLPGSAGLTAVSVFDSQVLAFSSLLYWALQSVTQLLPIKKKINWDAAQSLSKTVVTFSHCLLLTAHR